VQIIIPIDELRALRRKKLEIILLVIMIIVTIAMIAAVLIQRSEGGALGIGGPGAMFSARGSANFLTRITAGLAAAFMILSLVLAILSSRSDETSSVIESTGTNSLDESIIELKGDGVETVPSQTLESILESNTETPNSTKPPSFLDD